MNNLETKVMEVVDSVETLAKKFEVCGELTVCS